MEKKSTLKSEAAGLRKRALEVIHNNPQALAALPIGDIEQLAQELSVYQIELEMQNEELRNAQVDLERSRQAYSDLYDFAPVGYLTVDINGIIQRANLTATTMLGKERAYLIKQPFSKFIIPDDTKTYYLHKRNILETKESQECELQIIGQDGNVFWGRLRCCPVTDDDGEVTEIRSIMTDITERKKAQEKIASLAKFPAENPNPVFRITRNGTLLYANDAAKSFLVEWDCQVGQTVPVDWQHRVTDVFLKATEGRVEVDHRKNIFSFFIVPVINEDYANIYGRDITKRKQFEQERKRLLTELESKNDELQNIVYVSSHDLKSPLVNIDGFGDLLATHCQKLSQIMNNLHDDDATNALRLSLEHDIAEDLEFIHSSTRKMYTLIEGLLRVSRVGTTAMDITELDMDQLVRAVIDDFQYTLDEMKVDIIIDPLQACIADDRQTSQVFANLIDNALKYRDPAREPRIHISCTEQEGNIIYCVEDNGIGVRPEFHKRIFEVFHRLEPKKSDGEGLGLSIIRRILDRQNGRVWVESEEGKGSTFFVSLPRA